MRGAAGSDRSSSSSRVLSSSPWRRFSARTIDSPPLPPPPPPPPRKRNGHGKELGHRDEQDPGATWAGHVVRVDKSGHYVGAACQDSAPVYSYSRLDRP
ncbi:unnamed protein product [Lampetra planeri]